jgi:hypothetical protein
MLWGRPSPSSTAASSSVVFSNDSQNRRETAKQFVARLLAASDHADLTEVDDCLVVKAQAVGWNIIRLARADEIEFVALLMGLSFAQGALLAMADEECAFADSPRRMVDVHDRLELFRVHALGTYRMLRSLKSSAN